MSDVLCTFSGKYGDILWSLPTAREISRLLNTKVDFLMMPYYNSLIPLLEQQEYFDRVGVITNWLRTHSNHGDQPWQPPAEVSARYRVAYHLTFKAHPGISAPNMPLVDFVAYQQQIQLKEPVCPFLEVGDEAEELASQIHFSTGPFMDVVRRDRLITYAFNEQYDPMKKEFFEELYSQVQGDGFEFLNCATLDWREAAWCIKNSLAFVGCRSANWVVAEGLGQKTFTYEPHPARHQAGFLGTVFSNPHGQETTMPFAMPPRECAKVMASALRERHKREMKKYELAT